MEETSVRLNPIGSVLIAMYGATIGKLGILGIEATTNQACCACYPMKKLYSLLKTKRILENKSTAVLKKRGLNNILNNLAYVPIKYFALSSISTALLSFVVPMKIYYLIFALINALLGIIVFFLSKRQSA